MEGRGLLVLLPPLGVKTGGGDSCHWARRLFAGGSRVSGGWLAFDKWGVEGFRRGWGTMVIDGYDRIVMKGDGKGN